MFDLSKNELIKVVKAYNNYVMEYFEEHNEGCPVSIYEFYDNEYQELYQTNNTDTDNLSWLRQKFYEQFNLEMCASDIMDLVDEQDLQDYIFEQFKNSFMYGELFELFKDELNEEELESLLEDMGYDYVNLDELDEEEREKYF